MPTHLRTNKLISFPISPKVSITPKMPNIAKFILENTIGDFGPPPVVWFWSKFSPSAYHVFDLDHNRHLLEVLYFSIIISTQWCRVKTLNSNDHYWHLLGRAAAKSEWYWKSIDEEFRVIAENLIFSIKTIMY